MMEYSDCGLNHVSTNNPRQEWQSDGGKDGQGAWRKVGVDYRKWDDIAASELEQVTLMDYLIHGNMILWRQSPLNASYS